MKAWKVEEMGNLSIFYCANVAPSQLHNINSPIIQKIKASAENVFAEAMMTGLVKNDCDAHCLLTVEPDFIGECTSTYEGLINIHYLKKYHNNIINHAQSCIQTFVALRRFAKQTRGLDRVILFSVMRPSVTIGGLIASKIFGIPRLGIVMDVPGYRIAGEVKHLEDRIANFFSGFLFNRYDAYLFLSKAMVNLLSKRKKKPYIIMEGIYQNRGITTSELEASNIFDSSYFNILYTGSLYYEYGIMNLVKAVQQIEKTKVRLTIYGRGDAMKEIKEIAARDDRIVYRGIVSHNKILLLEPQADLLVNPRPVDEDYVKYSFPSKNMEYLASGTPVLMTNIPSLPEEYHKYAYIIENNNIENLRKSIEDIIKMDEKHKRNMAATAKMFILNEKNERVQAHRLISFIRQNVLDK